MTLRPEFNPDYEFIVSNPRGLIVGSSLFKMGAPFDKSLVTIRLLRQLYEARQIDRVSEVAVPATIEPVVEAKAPTTRSRPRPRRRFSDGGSS